MTSSKYLAALLISSTAYCASAKTFTILNTGCNSPITYQVISSTKEIKTSKSIDDNDKVFKRLISDNLYVESGTIYSNDSKAFQLEQVKRKPYPQIISVNSLTKHGKKITTEFWLNKNSYCEVTSITKCYTINYATTPRFQICKRNKD